jgi:hypothetical protein
LVKIVQVEHSTGALAESPPKAHDVEPPAAGQKAAAISAPSGDVADHFSSPLGPGNCVANCLARPSFKHHFDFGNSQ